MGVYFNRETPWRVFIGPPRTHRFRFRFRFSGVEETSISLDALAALALFTDPSLVSSAGHFFFQKEQTGERMRSLLAGPQLIIECSMGSMDQYNIGPT